MELAECCWCGHIPSLSNVHTFNCAFEFPDNGCCAEFVQMNSISYIIFLVLFNEIMIYISNFELFGNVSNFLVENFRLIVEHIVSQAW